MVWCFNKYRDHIACLLYLYLKETGWKNLMCPGYSPVLGCCEHGDEPLGSIEFKDFFCLSETPRAYERGICSMELDLFVCLLL